MSRSLSASLYSTILQTATSVSMDPMVIWVRASASTWSPHMPPIEPLAQTSKASQLRTLWTSPAMKSLHNRSRLMTLAYAFSRPSTSQPLNGVFRYTRMIVPCWLMKLNGSSTQVPARRTSLVSLKSPTQPSSMKDMLSATVKDTSKLESMQRRLLSWTRLTLIDIRLNLKIGLNPKSSHHPSSLATSKSDSTSPSLRQPISGVCGPTRAAKTRTYFSLSTLMTWPIATQLDISELPLLREDAIR